MSQNLKDLSAAGVSIWLDDLSRKRIESGDLARLVRERDVVGVTTNPTIFAGALAGGEGYADRIAACAASGKAFPCRSRMRSPAVPPVWSRTTSNGSRGRKIATTSSSSPSFSSTNRAIVAKAALQLARAGSFWAEGEMQTSPARPTAARSSASSRLRPAAMDIAR